MDFYETTSATLAQLKNSVIPGLWILHGEGPDPEDGLHLMSWFYLEQITFLNGEIQLRFKERTTETGLAYHYEDDIPFFSLPKTRNEVDPSILLPCQYGELETIAWEVKEYLKPKSYKVIPNPSLRTLSIYLSY